MELNKEKGFGGVLIYAGIYIAAYCPITKIARKTTPAISHLLAFSFISSSLLMARP
jgi:hypothetical protein